MPASYAHLTFGRRVRNALSEGGLKKIIENYIDLFEIGLQGPDILFFYHPLGHHPINRMGHTLHEETGASFLNRPVCRAADDAGLAYLLGFVCHFTLDSECHTLVEYYMKRTGKGHSDLETDLERALLAQAGLNPRKTTPAAYLVNTKSNAAVIAPFYNTEEKQIKTALSTMKLVGRALTPSNRVKHALLTRGVRLLGESHPARELVMDWVPDPVYEPSNRAIIDRMEQAIPIAVGLMENYKRWHDRGVNLAKRFERTFCFDPEELAQLEERENRV